MTSHSPSPRRGRTALERASAPSGAVGTSQASAAATVSAPSADDEFFRHIVEGMRNGILAITRNATLAVLNAEGYRIFGVQRQANDLGKPIAEVLREHPDVLRMLISAFELHMLPNRAELRLKPSGKVLGYTLAFVRDDAGDVAGITMFFKDLTRVEQIEERERLRDRLAAVGEMAAAIAHEVKNPLAGIKVMAGLLRRKIAGLPDAQAVLTDIINEANMANAIVQEVLEFVRPIRLQVEHTGVAESLQTAVHNAETKVQRRGIVINVGIAETLPRIQGDRYQLTQLFTNLLTNAYEAMDGKGRIDISATTVRQEDGGDGREAVRIEFKDDGPGMPHDVADRVFAPFFTTKARGSGLGLSIVRQIVDAHDGQIDLRTAPGEGTLIRITLPVLVIRDIEPTT